MLVYICTFSFKYAFFYSNLFSTFRLSLPLSNNISGHGPPPLPRKQLRSSTSRQTAISEGLNKEGLSGDRIENLTSPDISSSQMRNIMCPCQTKDESLIAWDCVQAPEPVELCSCHIRYLPVASSKSVQTPEPSMQVPPRYIYILASLSFNILSFFSVWVDIRIFTPCSGACRKRQLSSNSPLNK